MKVFDVYVNTDDPDNEGYMLICAKEVEDVIPVIQEDKSSPLFEENMKGITFKIVENKHVYTELREPRVISFTANF